MRTVIDPDFAESTFIRSTFKPYQQKTVYEVMEDSSAFEGDDDSENEDLLQDEDQPYETAASIAFGNSLKQIPVKELARRSDIIITSTLSVSMFPKDKRLIQFKMPAKMTYSELVEYVDERNAFSALVKEHKYKVLQTREKDKEFKETYMKSFIHRSTFESKTLKSFKDGVKGLNKNLKAKKPITKEQQQLEKLKHDQNKRASEKRGLPKLDMD
mmetsp:Transcript_20713/g.31747  ORF Transcript_20713/g.31747 Transcript_20713/m.31747 type:complete len:214 (-) Transcript_20713:4170-4811(-)